eukprot:snap_masked-scaffold_5-processed-gene-5.32-mRNA-1 protein AED:1.00 eAED:1.00 QI:0/0/0/0/1/1/2/0/99
MLYLSTQEIPSSSQTLKYEPEKLTEGLRYSTDTIQPVFRWIMLKRIPITRKRFYSNKKYIPYTNERSDVLLSSSPKLFTLSFVGDALLLFFCIGLSVDS